MVPLPQKSLAVTPGYREMLSSPFKSLTFAGSRLDSTVDSGRPVSDLSFRSYFLISSPLVFSHSGDLLETVIQCERPKRATTKIPQKKLLFKNTILIVDF